MPTPSEAAFERLLASFDASVSPAAAPAHEPRVFLSELYARAAEFLERDRFATIGEANEFYTKVVGVSFEGRQSIAGGLAEGDRVELVRDPGNAHDPNAIAVRFGALQIGFLRKEIARRLAPKFDSGERYDAQVASRTGGGEKHVGINLHVRRLRGRPLRARPDAERRTLGSEAIRGALIGDYPLRRGQLAVLERLAAGRNVLAVFGTGRGKSLCWSLPAAEGALARRQRTLAICPLRALANDQFRALERRLEPLGLRILRAIGSIESDERERLTAALADGSWDIVIATPEFVWHHRDAFGSALNRPHLLAVDEAHHLYDSRHRDVYVRFAELRAALGDPQTVALTATAGDEAFATIRKTLAVESWIVDPTVRENLRVVDARNGSDKFAYLVRELGTSGKVIVYTNSRNETSKLAARLRSRFGDGVGFYHAGVPSAERGRLEEFFRAGAIRIVVATSAFGEGIDLPDVRDVVLYHLNFDFTDFNQQAGRAGRDGAPARIHLLYGERDRALNEFIISRAAPSVPTMREIYRELRRVAPSGTLRTNLEELARTFDLEAVDGATIRSALRTFEEAGLVELGLDDAGRFVRFLESAGKVDLTATTRYAEGLAERESFARFCELALGAEAATLEQIVNRPIYPGGIALER